MSEIASIQIKFNNLEDARKAYDALYVNNVNLVKKLSLDDISMTIDGNGDSYSDYDLFEDAAKLIGEIGIKFTGVRNYCSYSTGNEYSETFSSDGQKLIILDEHECVNCGKIVTSKNGMYYSDGYGADEWYCKECGKEFLNDLINEKIEDEDLEIEEYLPNEKELGDLSIKELAEILDSIEPDVYTIEV